MPWVMMIVDQFGPPRLPHQLAGLACCYISKGTQLVNDVLSPRCSGNTPDGGQAGQRKEDCRGKGCCVQCVYETQLRPVRTWYTCTSLCAPIHTRWVCLLDTQH